MSAVSIEPMMRILAYILGLLYDDPFRLPRHQIEHMLRLMLDKLEQDREAAR